MIRFRPLSTYYNAPQLQLILSQLEQDSDNQYRKNQDVLVNIQQRLILTASDGSKWQVVVSPAGALSTVAVP
jgi:hypothetical protein